MIPPAIVAAAIDAGLSAIAITDHNTAENVPAVTEAADSRIAVIGGMEMTTAEEIHLLGLFPTMEALFDMQRVIYEHLPGENDAERFGPQYVVDGEGYIVAVNGKLLAGATDLPLETMIDLAHDRSGITVACHVDRESFSLMSQLGFIPETLPIDAIELSAHAGDELYRRAYPATLVTGSDAHFPEHVGSAATTVTAAEATFEELVLALRGVDGRSVSVAPAAVP